MNNNPIFCLMGPTASGKTALALHLAKTYPVEIISVDSALIYREMDIGTAKPSAEELSQAPHFLIDILDPPQSFSAREFCSAVQKLAEEIFARGKFPLLVGGTMMYFHALHFGLSELPSADSKIRRQLLNQAEMLGWPAMHQKLCEIDPFTAIKIHAHDAQRIQRALEVFALTGKKLSELKEAEKNPFDYQFCNIILYPEDRAWLHQRIATRFEQMLQQGFISEVEQLIKNWHLSVDCPAGRAVGYRQAIEYLNGQTTKEEFREKAIAATRQLAKRQLTWLRSWQQSQIFPCEDLNTGNKIVAMLAKIIDNSCLKK